MKTGKKNPIIRRVTALAMAAVMLGGAAALPSNVVYQINNKNTTKNEYQTKFDQYEKLDWQLIETKYKLDKSSIDYYVDNYK
ncbi:MAG: hypothetical protein IJ192_14585 [Clostridia bacterium]|nr:hypothetical protein [Clostridia bacterium]